MLLLNEGGHIRRRHSLQELDIFIGVKLRHLSFRGRLCSLQRLKHSIQLRSSSIMMTHEDLHLLVQSIVHNERVTHPYARWLHPALGSVPICVTTVKKRTDGQDRSESLQRPDRKNSTTEQATIR